MSQLNSTTRQVYPSRESPYEPNVGGQKPNQVFPDDGLFPLGVGDPGFLMGTAYVELPGVADVLIQADVPYPLRLKKSDLQENIITGDISQVDDTMPDFFWQAADYHRIQAPVMANHLMVLQYRDYAQKHPSLKRPYRVAIVVEYLERHPDIEALADAALRERIYADLAISEYSMLVIDVDRYKNDPDYSAASEIRDRDNKYFDADGHFHPSVESYKLANADTELPKWTPL